MCEVYEFPMKKLPKDLEERLQKIAEDYVKAVDDILNYIVDKYGEEDNAEDIMEMVTNFYTKAVLNAVEKI